MAKSRSTTKRPNPNTPTQQTEFSDLMTILADESEPGEFATDVLKRIVRERNEYRTKVQGRFVD